MPGFMPGIHVWHRWKDVGGWDEPGHDKAVDAGKRARAGESVLENHNPNLPPVKVNAKSRTTALVDLLPLTRTNLRIVRFNLERRG